MKAVFRHNQLFTFLLYCNGTNLEKKVLDCGAGGPTPPLAIFHENGYETHGVEIDEKQLQLAHAFEKQHGLNLNIIKGDMLKLPYDNESFGFVFSYNAIFHMSKHDINKAIQEIHRVLKPGGLCFINFASFQDDRAQFGEKKGEGEYLQEEHGQMVLHSYHNEYEAEHYFENNGFEVIYKEVRKRTGPARTGGKVTLGYIDYIVEKK